ncbi:hypothetical protein LWI29_000977 [Acer saccharum]|uniref:Uncharacterized protein n=1 Tax=Acer saccharum TaxID=4024 RepID=A0AA39SHB8_ACESA|nr:hypothetical protein LWI29_000977 [Acer saccharum]
MGIYAIVNELYLTPLKKENPNPPLSSTKPQFNNNPFLSFSVNSATQLLKKQIKSQENKLCCLSESVARTSLLALVSASLFFVDPVLAYKGGGPYGSEKYKGTISHREGL